MSKIIASNDLQRVPDDKFKNYLFRFLDNVQQVVNGQIELVTNIRGQIHEVSFPVANTDVIVTHGLGKTPIGYIPISLSAAMSVYESQRNEIYIILRSSAVGSATIFIL